MKTFRQVFEGEVVRIHQFAKNLPAAPEKDIGRANILHKGEGWSDHADKFHWQNKADVENHFKGPPEVGVADIEAARGPAPGFGLPGQATPGMQKRVSWATHAPNLIGTAEHHVTSQNLRLHGFSHTGGVSSTHDKGAWQTVQQGTRMQSQSTSYENNVGGSHTVTVSRDKDMNLSWSHHYARGRSRGSLKAKGSDYGSLEAHLQKHFPRQEPADRWGTPKVRYQKGDPT